jgi:hypothetical protein
VPEFELFHARTRRQIVRRFNTDVDPRDEEACVGLLRSLARQHQERPADVVLKAYGRYMREFRTT